MQIFNQEEIKRLESGIQKRLTNFLRSLFGSQVASEVTVILRVKGIVIIIVRIIVKMIVRSFVNIISPEWKGPIFSILKNRNDFECFVNKPLIFDCHSAFQQIGFEQIEKKLFKILIFV